MIANGLFGPTVDDLFRVAIVVIGVLNVAVVMIGLLLLRRYARLLLDVEQASREARNRLREQVDVQVRALARDMATVSADVAALRAAQEGAAAQRRTAAG